MPSHELIHGEQVEYDRLASLVAAYEPLRRHRTPERRRAERALGLALSHHGPFRLAGKVWQWSYLDDSVICRPAQLVNHPHHQQPRESIEVEVAQSSRRQCGRAAGTGQAFGGWSIKGRSL